MVLLQKSVMRGRWRNKLGMAVHATPAFWEAEAGWSVQLPSQAGLTSEVLSQEQSKMRKISHLPLMPLTADCDPRPLDVRIHWKWTLTKMNTCRLFSWACLCTLSSPFSKTHYQPWPFPTDHCRHWSSLESSWGSQMWQHRPAIPHWRDWGRRLPHMSSRMARPTEWNIFSR